MMPFSPIPPTRLTQARTALELLIPLAHLSVPLLVLPQRLHRGASLLAKRALQPCRARLERFQLCQRRLGRGAPSVALRAVVLGRGARAAQRDVQLGSLQKRGKDGRGAPTGAGTGARG
eukprot:360363-Chlamydomonas_euryale.AAC.1